MRKYPKGFDITLMDAISQYQLNEEQIKRLGTETHDRTIAHAFIGHQVYYRRVTIERMFCE